MSIESIKLAITARVTRSASTPMAPLPNTSARASTSLVSRVSNLPTGVRSWKLSERLRAWRNKSTLSRAVSRCPMVCTKKLWLPWRAKRSTTAPSSIATRVRIAWAMGMAASQGQAGSWRSTEIACPTSSGCTALAPATGNSNTRAVISRRRSRYR